MRTYEIAVVVLFVLLVLITEMMRRQVHEARYGSQKISPWDVRFVNDLLGQYGIWISHKRLYQRSGLRSPFWAILIALFICLGLGAYVYLHAHR